MKRSTWSIIILLAVVMAGGFVLQYRQNKKQETRLEKLEQSTAGQSKELRDLRVYSNQQSIAHTMAEDGFRDSLSALGVVSAWNGEPPTQHDCQAWDELGMRTQRGLWVPKKVDLRPKENMSVIILARDKGIAAEVHYYDAQGDLTTVKVFKWYCTGELFEGITYRLVAKGIGSLEVVVNQDVEIGDQKAELTFVYHDPENPYVYVFKGQAFVHTLFDSGDMPGARDLWKKLVEATRPEI